MNSSSLIPSIMNILIILFVFKVIRKAIKKHRNENQTETHTSSDKQEGTQTFDRPVAQVRKNKFETKPLLANNIQLKRCPNCGGEIPFTMMKCDICGTRQAGCGVTVFIVIIVLGILWAVVSSNNIEFVIWEHMQMFFQWLGSL